jgi:EAL domain-containing protein (putative c-di-GMP-specific phosphodiesterase class I)
MVEPRRLRLEISETALMGENDLTDRTVRALQGLGVQIAIDNFGTAYSSLGLVRGFQVQTVKIDRSLVSSCPDRRECSALVEAVGAMARNLGFTVVAEGVETEEERRLMSTLGCDRAQGYLLGRPVDASQIAEFSEHRGQATVSRGVRSSD